MLSVDKDRCLECGACVSTCSTNALTLYSTGLLVQQSICTECGTCAHVCPIGALKLTQAEE